MMQEILVGIQANNKKKIDDLSPTIFRIKSISEEWQ